MSICLMHLQLQAAPIGELLLAALFFPSLEVPAILVHSFPCLSGWDCDRTEVTIIKLNSNQNKGRVQALTCPLCTPADVFACAFVDFATFATQQQKLEKVMLRLLLTTTVVSRTSNFTSNRFPSYVP